MTVQRDDVRDGREGAMAPGKRPDAEAMGPVVRDFPPKGRGELYRAFLARGWGLFAIAALIALVAVSVTDARGDAALIARVSAWFALFVFAVASLIRIAGASRMHITVYEQGLRCQHDGLRAKVLRWEEVELRYVVIERVRKAERALVDDTVLDRWRELRIRPHGRSFEIILDRGIQEYDVLCKTIQQATSERVVAGILKAVDAGEPVSVGGGLHIEVDGVRRDGVLARWETITTVDVQGAHLHVGPFVCLADDVSNVYAIAEVMRLLADRARPAAAYR